MEGAVKVQLDKERQLYFDINALADIDDQLRVGIAQLFSSGDWRISDVRTLLWAGLKSEDATLTKERAGELIQEYIRSGSGIMSDITALIMRAFRTCGFISSEKKAEAPESPSPASVNGYDKPSGTLTDR